VLAKLEENYFQVRYTHPNLIFISWGHYIPTYVRTEFKKKTGIAIDEHGNRKDENMSDGTDGGGGIRLITNSGSNENENLDHALLNRNKSMTTTTATTGLGSNVVIKKEYKPITSYKPTGNLVYSNDFLKKIDERINS
jgi:hypothetical protein